MGRDDGANLRANWERQEFRGATLFVIENGPGLGTCARNGVDATVFSSERHQSHARNGGLDVAIARHFTHWRNWDSDDWYGANDLAESVAAFAAGHEVIGKSDHFCELSDGRLVLLGADGENRETQALQGPTLGSVLWPDMPRFPVVDIGEDIDWTAAMVAAGMRPWATSRNHFCYSRRGKPEDHACDVTDAELLYFRAGDAHIVHCESRLAVLNGTEAPRLTLHAPEPRPVWDHPQIRKRGPRSTTRPQTRGNFWPSDVFDPSNFDAGIGTQGSRSDNEHW
jgi:hypothetical protein